MSDKVVPFRSKAERAFWEGFSPQARALGAALAAEYDAALQRLAHLIVIRGGDAEGRKEWLESARHELEVFVDTDEGARNEAIRRKARCHPCPGCAASWIIKDNQTRQVSGCSSSLRSWRLYASKESPWWMRSGKPAAS